MHQLKNDLKSSEYKIFADSDAQKEEESTYVDFRSQVDCAA